MIPEKSCYLKSMDTSEVLIPEYWYMESNDTGKVSLLEKYWYLKNIVA